MAVHAKIYDQEGNLLPFVMADSLFARQFREWLARHDRHTPTTQEPENG